MTTGDSGNGEGGAPASGTLLTNPGEGEKKPADNSPPGEKKPDANPPTDNKEGEKKDATAEKDKDAEGDKSKKAGAPEKYEDFKMPEGVSVDKAKLDTFIPLAKELNLSQEQAQKLVDFYANAQADAMTGQAKTWNETTDGWRKSAQEDKEFGGKDMEQNLSHASRFRDTFGTPELQKFLNDYRVGDHPEMIRLFVRAGKAMAEDKFRAGNAREGGEDTPREKILFPNMR